MFATLNQQTAEAISTAENLVEQLKQQLKQAQDTLNNLYQQQQLEQTAQGTVQTALDLAHKAYHALETAYPNNPEAISEFEEAFLSLRTHQPQPGIKPTVKDQRRIKPAVTDIHITPEPNPEPAPDNSHNDNGNGHKPKLTTLSVDELKVLPRETLSSLCSRFNQPKNGNRLHLAKRLVGLVTNRDVIKPESEPELEF